MLLITALLPASLGAGESDWPESFLSGLPVADVQFFGDLYVPPHVSRELGSKFVLDDVHHLLRSSMANVVNFEGAATTAFVPMTTKQYVLKMPLDTAERLSVRGITHATLANNHAMDWGVQGLFDSIVTLEKAGIKIAGAGMNAAEAEAPLILSQQGKPDICINAVSRTFPKAFWADATRPGSASPELPKLREIVQEQRARGCIPLVSIHWGSELTRKPQDYQRRIAHQLIDAGASAIIGHHPHLLQEIEIYKNAPVFYSIGNFAFGTRPTKGAQEGLALRILLTPEGELDFMGIALNVSNSKVHFKPRLFTKGETDPLKRFQTKALRCEGKNPFTVCFSTKKTLPSAAVFEIPKNL